MNARVSGFLEHFRTHKKTKTFINSSEFISIRATLDTTRSDGDQFFYIEDEQSTD